jgi:CRP/FNR family transcriptional regulator, cyclic AMP receptor protein
MDEETSKPFETAEYLKTEGDGRSILQHKKHQSFFVQGDRADSVYYLQHGRAKLTVVSKKGKEATVTLLGPGDFFGEEAMAGAEAHRTSTSTAVTICGVLKITRAQMIHTLHVEHTFSDFFLHYILKRGIRTQADLVDQLFNSSERRLARTLLLMAEFGKAEGMTSPIPAVTQETLAEMIGTTRSRVSFFMNRFRKLGYIDYNGRIHVHRSLLNMVLQDHLPEENAARPKIVDRPRRPTRIVKRPKKRPDQKSA